MHIFKLTQMLLIIAAFLGFSCPPNSGLQGFQKFKSPTDCRQYFICMNESPRLLACELGHVFDERTGNCVDPGLVPGW